MWMGYILLLEDRLDQNKAQMYGIFKRWSKIDDTEKLKWDDDHNMPKKHLNQ